mmetsp:Transcript_41513/g.114289  ORF Transcript_41513/g.114289 Transcript_41513/m.114289 type:complete len:160 (+) Transcript_41513:715-1194(+)
MRVSSPVARDVGGRSGVRVLGCVGVRVRGIAQSILGFEPHLLLVQNVHRITLQSGNFGVHSWVLQANSLNISSPSPPPSPNPPAPPSPPISPPPSPPPRLPPTQPIVKVTGQTPVPVPALTITLYTSPIVPNATTLESVQLAWFNFANCSIVNLPPRQQ